MTSKPSQQELLNRYLKHADDLDSQQASGEPMDIARRAMALYGADDAVRDLLSRFAVDVIGSSEHKQ